ncbi:hypothetical protein ACHWQZ_G006456 [Mnemiopsis leidyi]
MEEEAKESKPASVVVPSVANEGEGSSTSVVESQLTATKPPKKGTGKASGNCVPEAFYWSVDEVASWVEDIGFWQYKGCFTENFVNGRKLILMDANSLPRIGIQDFDHIKTICSAIRDVLGIEGPDSKRTIYLPPRDHLATFLEAKAILGPHSDSLEFEPLPS